jgi:hypothetical protein
MQEQAEAQQQESLPMMNSQVDENSRSSWWVLLFVILVRIIFFFFYNHFNKIFVMKYIFLWYIWFVIRRVLSEKPIHHDKSFFHSFGWLVSSILILLTIHLLSLIHIFEKNCREATIIEIYLIYF